MIAELSHKKLLIAMVMCMFVRMQGLAYSSMITWEFDDQASFVTSTLSDIEIVNQSGYAHLLLYPNFVLSGINDDLGNSYKTLTIDINDDTYSDLYVVNQDGQNRLRINDGLGNGGASFTGSYIVGDSVLGTDSVFFDLDNDGDLDLYSAEYNNTGLPVQNRLRINDGLGNGAASFTLSPIAGDVVGAIDAVAADIDNDGDIDLYVATDGQNRLRINDGLGNGGASFTLSTIAGDMGFTYGVIANDLDNDGDIDLYASNADGQNRLRINDGLGNGGVSFTERSIVGDTDVSSFAREGDLDNDGDIDLFIPNFGTQNTLRLNNGSANFTSFIISGATDSSTNMVLVDVNNDNLIDIHVAEFGQNKLRINQGLLYSSLSPYIQPTTSQPFSFSIDSFSHILGTGNQGTVSYQVSTDNGTTWNYRNGSAWTGTTQTDGTETSPVGDITTHISTLDTDGGDFLWRAYLNSDSTQAVELDQVAVVYDLVITPPTITIVDDVEVGPVSSDTLLVDVVDAGTGATSIVATGSLMYGFTSNPLVCDASVVSGSLLYSTGTALTFVDESHNGNYLCFQAADQANNTGYLLSSFPLNIDITPPTFVSISTTSVYERNFEGSYSASITATDTNGPVTFSACSATTYLDVDSTGVVTQQVSEFDFENPQDTNRDNTYELCVTMEDTAGNTSQTTISVSVLDVTEGGSGGGGGGGGERLSRISICTDPTASNYDDRSGSRYRSDDDECVYDEDEDTVEDPTSIDDDTLDEDDVDELFNPDFGAQCFSPLNERTLYQNNNVSDQFRIAHQMLYSYGLTRWRGTADYGPTLHLTRAQAARFLVMFAENVLCREPARDYDEQFSDLDDADQTLTSFVRDSYEYKIFQGYPNGTFRPNKIVSSEEMSALVVRLVTHDIMDEPNTDWSINYRRYLDNRTSMGMLTTTRRDAVAEIMYDLYRNNDYTREEGVGYVIED